MLPHFARNSLLVARQLVRSPGLLGYSSGARLGSLEFWSVSAWEDEGALMGFVRAEPHAGIMEDMRPSVARAEFVRWKVSGAEVPPDAREAEKRLRRKLAAASPAG